MTRHPALRDLYNLMTLDEGRLQEDNIYEKWRYDVAVRCIVRRELLHDRDPSRYFDYLGSKLNYANPEALIDTRAARAEQDAHHRKLSFRSMTMLYSAWLRSQYFIGI
jgi:hypothetical protein